jgi:hypothetical protein
VNEKTLKKYLEYLNLKLSLPCAVTGREDFEWEEFCVLGPGDKNEYKRLKRNRPSYTDEFEILNFLDEPDDFHGILVRVRRPSDRKQFDLPLESLKTLKKDNNAQLLDDYSVWFVNYR